MAVDIGKLIAESIDGHYAYNRIIEEMRQDNLNFLESLAPGFKERQILKEARFDPDDPEYLQDLYGGGSPDDEGEGDPDGGSDDDEDDAAADWLKQNDPGAQEPEKPEAAPSAGVKKTAAPAGTEKPHPGGTPERRKGYQAGWVAAKRGQEATPKEGGEYGEGYMDGYKTSGSAHKVAAGVSKAQELHAGGDVEGAASHVKTDVVPHRNELISHLMPHFKSKMTPAQYMPILKDQRGNPADKNDVDIAKTMAAAEMIQNWIQQTTDRTQAGGRSAFSDAVSKKVAHHADAEGSSEDPDHPFDPEHEQHPSTFPEQIYALGRHNEKLAAKHQANKAARERLVQGMAQADPGQSEGGQPSAPEGLATPDEKKAAVQVKRAVKAGGKLKAAAQARGGEEMDPVDFMQMKESLAKSAFSPEEYQAHVDQHGAHPLDHHTTPEEAEMAAINHWHGRMHKVISDAEAEGMFVKGRYKNDPVPTGEMNPDGTPQTVIFDKARAFHAMINHPNGAFARGHMADAIREQIPGYTGRHKNKPDHPAQPVAAKLQRMKGWLAKQHDHFSHKLNEIMFQRSQFAAAKKARKMSRHAGLRQKQTEALFSLFRNWIDEHVDLYPGRLDVIMADLRNDYSNRVLAETASLSVAFSQWAPQ